MVKRESAGFLRNHLIGQGTVRSDIQNEIETNFAAIVSAHLIPRKSSTCQQSLNGARFKDKPSFVHGERGLNRFRITDAPTQSP